MASEQFGEILKDSLDELCTKSASPGAAVAVIHEQKTYSAASGFTEAGGRNQCTAETPFPIGCVIKPFTASLIMSLVEKGKLELDAPVQSYLPEFASGTPERSSILLRHLLTHTSGIDDDPLIDTGMDPACFAKLESETRQLQQLAPPGRYFSYCSIGYMLCGSLMERVTGCTPDVLINENICAPLNIENPFQDRRNSDNRPAREHMLSGRGNRLVPVAPHYPRCLNMAGSGAVSLSVLDMLKFARVHLPSSRPQAEKLGFSPEAMHRRYIEITGSRMPYDGWGLGWSKRGTDMSFHMGGVHGSFAALFILRNHDTAIALTMNRSHTPLTYNFIGRLVKALTGIVFRKPRTPQPSDSNDAAPILGTFNRLMGSITIQCRDGRMIGSYQAQRKGEPVGRPREFDLIGVGEDSYSIKTRHYVPFDSINFLNRETDGTQFIRAGRFVYRRV